MLKLGVGIKIYQFKHIYLTTCIMEREKERQRENKLPNIFTKPKWINNMFQCQQICMFG